MPPPSCPEACYPEDVTGVSASDAMEANAAPGEAAGTALPPVALAVGCQAEHVVRLSAPSVPPCD